MTKAKIAIRFFDDFHHETFSNHIIIITFTNTFNRAKPANEA